MGKDKRKRTSKSVFKVAGSRSLKAKNKAKSVTTQLKKLIEVNKRKIAEVDQQLTLLQKEVGLWDQNSSIENGENESSKEIGRLLLEENIKKFEEGEKKSAEALEKLNDMSM